MFGFRFRKSSIAMLAATTDPCPLESESGPVASLITPILTVPPEISPAETGDPKATKVANSAAANAFLHPRSEVLTSSSCLKAGSGVARHERPAGKPLAKHRLCPANEAAVSLASQIGRSEKRCH